MNHTATAGSLWCERRMSKATMKKLMTDQDSLSWINTEVTQLESMIEEVAGPAGG